MMLSPLKCEIDLGSLRIPQFCLWRRHPFTVHQKYATRGEKDGQTCDKLTSRQAEEIALKEVNGDLLFILHNNLQLRVKCIQS